MYVIMTLKVEWCCLLQGRSRTAAFSQGTRSAVFFTRKVLQRNSF